MKKCIQILVPAGMSDAEVQKQLPTLPEDEAERNALIEKLVDEQLAVLTKRGPVIMLK